MGVYDIAVAGCGPAGLAAALMLARDGHRVRLYERFDAPRPIGSGLMIQPTGFAVPDRLPPPAPPPPPRPPAPALAGAAAPIERGFGKAGDRVVLDVRYEWLRRPGACGWGLHRATLFDI